MEKKKERSGKKKVNTPPDYLEEARRIEEEIENMEDPWADDPQIEERLRRNVYRRILEEQQSIIRKRSRVQRAGKYLAMVLITCVALFGVSMTSQANRQRFIQSITYMIGGEEAIEISNAENLDDSDREEELVREEIEKKIGCEYPIFMYRPPKFMLEKYTVLKESQNAFVEYSCREQTLSLYITKSDDEFVNYLLHQGDVKQSFNVKNDQISIEVTERKDEGDEQYTYIAQWIYDNCFYDISVKMEKEEFIKFLKNIRF